MRRMSCKHPRYDSDKWDVVQTSLLQMCVLKFTVETRVTEQVMCVMNVLHPTWFYFIFNLCDKLCVGFRVLQ